jgi:hypothetical protein
VEIRSAYFCAGLKFKLHRLYINTHFRWNYLGPLNDGRFLEYDVGVEFLLRDVAGRPATDLVTSDQHITGLINIHYTVTNYHCDKQQLLIPRARGTRLTDTSL